MRFDAPIAPQPEPGGQQRGGAERVAVRERLPALGDQRVEAGRVEVTGGQGEGVAGRPVGQHLPLAVPEQPP